MKKHVNRVYDYFYTGKNTDVLSLELNFDFAFFTQVNADLGKKTGDSVPNAGLSGGSKQTNLTMPEGNQGGAGNKSFSGTSQPTIQNTWKVDGGAGADSMQTAQVRSLQSMLENPADLITIEMTVMGDPYYLPSSGLGNQIINEAGFNQLIDGSMNYQSGEVDFIVNFRTPTDINPKVGLYDFNRATDQYSGLYFINEVESRISHNKFTQIIKGTRRRAQLKGSAMKYSFYGIGGER
jgi:hypothetical protein